MRNEAHSLRLGASRTQSCTGTRVFHMNFRLIFRFELFVDPHDCFSGREFIDISASIFAFLVFLRFSGSRRSFLADSNLREVTRSATSHWLSALITVLGVK